MFADTEEYDRCLRHSDTVMCQQDLFGQTLVYNHAEMAPPPFAWPSILVTMIAPKFALSLNARACASAA